MYLESSATCDGRKEKINLTHILITPAPPD
jgi:hypothetical protein